MVDMCSRLRCYLYAFLLICVSTMSHALPVTDLETGHGGFAFPTICSHPTDLSFCVRVEDGAKAACALWQTTLDSTYSYSFTGVTTLSNGVQRCEWKGKNPSTNYPAYTSTELHKKSGLCPPLDKPPPELIKFGRQGRWFPQELDNERCYKSCLYTNGQSFTHKHYLFTNGVYTDFSENSDNRLRSSREFCYMKPEPIRDSSGEVTYESNCDDAMFKQICDFINWFRNDSEMPEAPKVEAEQINLGYIKADHVQIESNASNLCFAPYEFNFFLPWSRDEVKQEIRFDAICSKINEYGNLWRALYLLGACYIIFGGRK